MLSGLCANVSLWKMLAEVNAHLPQDNQFSWWWWTITKEIRLWKEHKRLCPNSPWRVIAAFSVGSALVFMILMAISSPPVAR